ncbi:endonuclease/exonuclease/phosphatase family protein [Glutamicibacter halophytocola]|uniref:endonuclease/exonuclease/phosphatase family protein n=1 Tax=Glutamicibacter halophytocola TaxID=1933880 RepID=UPI0032195FA4
MTLNRPRPRSPWLWAILMLPCLGIGILPYITWTAAGWVPRLQAFQPWMLLGIAVAVLLASFKRRWLVSAVVLVLLAIGAVPNLAMATGESLPSDATPELTVFSFNALKAGADAGQLSQSIKIADPDVLVLVETSEPLQQRLAAQGALDTLPYRSAPVPAGGEADTVIYSRYPARERSGSLGPDATNWYGLPILDIASPRGPITVVGVHIYPPLQDARRWQGGLLALRQWVAEQEDEPMILAGDFNSTRAHPQFRELASSMGPERSLFPISTWPTGGRVPPMIGIDHVLSRGFVPLKQETAKIDGSDHLALIVKLGVPH